MRIIDRKSIKRLSRTVAREGLKGFLRWLFPKINRQAIFIFGNEKSGTTAIAALLATYGGLTQTLDLPWRSSMVRDQDCLHSGKLSFDEFVEKYKFEFSSELIKEPALTFLYEQVAEVFTLSKAVFVVRDPRDNIRSILNRVKIPGNLERLTSMDTIKPAWQPVIDNRWLGLENEHYVNSLSARWNCAADVYFAHDDKLLLVRYEDFVADKIGTIERLAKALGISKVNDISDQLDVQYQPRGNRDVNLNEFFGLENMTRIEKICGSRMQRFGYAISMPPRTN